MRRRDTWKIWFSIIIWTGFFFLFFNSGLSDFLFGTPSKASVIDSDNVVEEFRCIITVDDSGSEAYLRSTYADQFNCEYRDLGYTWQIRCREGICKGSVWDNYERQQA